MAQNQEATERDLAGFAAWGEQQPTVRAMLLTSSLAVPGAPVDAFSDYDLILAVDDIHPFHRDRGWLADFGPVLLVYKDPITTQAGFEIFGSVIQYEDGLKIDFTLWPVGLLRQVAAAEALPAEFDAGYRVLVDKDGLTRSLKPPSYRGYIPTPPSENDYQDMIESFLNDAVYVAKVLWRGELLPAKHVLEHIMVQEHLLRVLTWHMEIRHGWSVKPGPFGRRLSHQLDPDLWAALEALYVGPGLEENWEALFASISLMRRAAIDVGEALGFTYPDDLVRRTVAYIGKVKDLDRAAVRLPWRNHP